MRQFLKLALLAGPLALAACDLDTTNPNAPTQETATTSPEGLIALGVGLQNRFGSSTGSFIYGAGLVTDELGAVAASFSTISDAARGTVPPNTNLAADIWNGSYRTVKTANDIIASAGNVDMPAGTRAGLLGMAYLFKAAALGEVLQAFQKLPIDTYNNPAATFVDRPTALAYVLALLDSADVAYNSAPISSQFTSQVLATGLSIPNTIQAYKARYRRLAATDAAGWQSVIAAADSVSRTVFSVLPFDATNRNPVFNTSSGSSGVLPRDTFRLSDPTEALRVAFHVTAGTPAERDPSIPLDNYARYSDPSASIPTYYPDEVLLIKAEALARLNQLPEAVAVLDSVRTDCPGAGAVTTDPGPCLAPYSGPMTQSAILDEIYRNRRYELFATGLRWEDARRLSSVGVGPTPGIATRCWLPYTIGERNTNPTNVPADPEGTEPPAFPASCF
ncbi:MAG TPA: RagB/SusD family nutrient uptake outer membrane protein [Gemmatimonadaceae bacterium]|nr:RagB/SusD family nutrient uptake outer membrane protein [Gemmatimonadaceae bacterium]